MSISSIPGQAISAYQKQQNSSVNLSKPETENSITAGLKEVTVRNEKQAVFVSHFFENSSDKREGALKITYKLAIEKLNEQFEAETGEKNVISEENLKKQGGMKYWSPENVAQRIVQGTTAFLDGFQKSHPELSGEALINKFLDVGRWRCQTRLLRSTRHSKRPKSLIADNYQKTFDLVQKGFEAFRRQQLGLPPLENSNTSNTQVLNKDNSSDTGA